MAAKQIATHNTTAPWEEVELIVRGEHSDPFHVLGAHPQREPKLTGPYTHEHPFHEPMVLFGFLAAVTGRLQLTTGILILPQRQTALVAKQSGSASKTTVTASIPTSAPRDLG